MVGCGWNGSAHSPSELLEPPFVVGLESADRFPRVAHAIPRIVLHLLPGKPPRSSSCSPGHRLQSPQATMRFLNHVPRRGLVVPLRSPMMLVNVPRPPREKPACDAASQIQRHTTYISSTVPAPASCNPLQPPTQFPGPRPQPAVPTSQCP
jgi:hypothetical protein